MISTAGFGGAIDVTLMRGAGRVTSYRLRPTLARAGGPAPGEHSDVSGAGPNVGGRNDRADAPLTLGSRDPRAL
jgi:hypothetical protein